jgi:hypothetical protein
MVLLLLPDGSPTVFLVSFDGSAPLAPFTARHSSTALTAPPSSSRTTILPPTAVPCCPRSSLATATPKQPEPLSDNLPPDAAAAPPLARARPPALPPAVHHRRCNPNQATVVDGAARALERSIFRKKIFVVYCKLRSLQTFHISFRIRLTF